MTVTPCEDCDFVAEHTRKHSPRQWLCLKFPRLENLDAVAPKQWVLHEPYNRCVNVNLGHCPLFEPRRAGKVPAKGKMDASEPVSE